MKIKIKTKNLNQPICSKNNNEYVGFMPTRNKGITLVALIITIIILLILAIVTIAAINKSNIIEKTKTSKEEYSIGEEKEKVTLAVQEANLEGQGTINNDNVTNGMNTYFTNDGWISLSSNAKKMKVKILESGNIYKIDLNTGNITDGQLNESWEDNGDGSYTKEESTYKIGDTITHGQVKKMLGITATSTYTDEQTWTVIGIENGKLKLVSTKKVGTCSFGAKDPVAIQEITVDNENNLTDKEYYLRKVCSFKNAENSLNKVTQENTGIENARTLKLEDINSIVDKNDWINIFKPIGEIEFKANDLYQCGYLIDDDFEMIELQEGQTYKFNDTISQCFYFDDINVKKYSYIWANETVWLGNTIRYVSLDENGDCEKGYGLNASCMLMTACMIMANGVDGAMPEYGVKAIIYID